MQAAASNPPGAVWSPDWSMVEDANLTRFMRAISAGSFEALNEYASANPAAFHDELLRFLGYHFQQPYEQVLDLSEGLPFARWCIGGSTNVVLNCLDRWRGTARYKQPALIWKVKVAQCPPVPLPIWTR
jgi:acetyl-CoA synthetase